jgi:hypothetical protein
MIARPGWDWSPRFAREMADLAHHLDRWERSISVQRSIDVQ